MTVTGIIAEFNPFHNGHKYLLSQAEGLKVVAMSGNFVQRGEPALIDKWTRAEMALKQGADIVVELPYLVAVQSADYFASGAVDILHRVGVDTLMFGTEKDMDYNHLSQIYQDMAEQMDDYLDNLPKSMTYPQKTQKMWQKFAGVEVTDETPNHNLGLAYAKACSGKEIVLRAIKRIGAGFHSEEKEEIASATAIRKHLADAEFVVGVTPEPNLILRSPRVSWQDFFPLLRYQIMTNKDLTQIFQVNEERAPRLCQSNDKARNIEELVSIAATNRYTPARIRRLLCHILVQAVEREMPLGIHVLGFSQKGQEHLGKVKKQVPLVTRIGRESWDITTEKADSIYCLGNSDMPEQTIGRKPIVLTDKN